MSSRYEDRKVHADWITREAMGDFSGWIHTAGLKTPEEVIVRLMNTGIKHGLVYLPPYDLECNECGICKGQKERNARLIAAAPEMLEILEEFIRVDTHDGMNLLHQMALKVIAKVKGEAE